jgi:outer membrane protein TolC
MLLPALLLTGSTLAAQDSVRLGPLHAAATERDPRVRQLALQLSASEARLRNLDTERLPQLRLTGQATRQSEVPSLPISLPGGMTPPVPPKNHYEVRGEVEQRVYDAGALARRRDIERARLAEAQAEVNATLFGVREEVNQAFFGALLLQAQLAELATLEADLEARLAQARVRVREGAALRSQAYTVEAELLKARQQRAELEANRRAALAVLSSLTGRRIGAADVLVAPSLADEIARARGAEDATTGRPERAVFGARRERLRREAALAGTRGRPQVQAFGQLGVGRPGLDQFRRDIHEFWIVGVRLRWTPWDWGVVRREQQVLGLQQQVVDTEEEAFAERVRRSTLDEVETMQRLATVLASDDELVALRERIAREALTRFGEGVMTAAEYVDVRSDVQEARIVRERHRVELAHARARYLTTLGVDLP